MTNDKEPGEEQQPTLVEGFNQMVDGLKVVATRMFEAVMPVLHAVHEQVWENYRAAGMPYGESQEGLMQWVGDMAKIRRAQIEREREESRLQMRLLGERIRAEMAEKEGQDDDPESA